MLLQTLHEFWAQTGVACWLEGQAHQAMETPCLLYTAGRGDFGEAVNVTATAWFSGKDAVKRRAELAGIMEDLLPAEGKRILAQGGMLVLERDREQCMEMIADEKDPMMMGIRIRAIMRVYG
jgi:hypothetical protein